MEPYHNLAIQPLWYAYQNLAIQPLWYAVPSDTTRRAGMQELHPGPWRGSRRTCEPFGYFSVTTSQSFVAALRWRSSRPVWVDSPASGLELTRKVALPFLGTSMESSTMYAG